MVAQWLRICLQCRRHRRHRFNPWSKRFHGEGNSNRPQYFCLESCKDRGAWRATGHRVAKNQTQLSTRARTHTHTHTHTHTPHIWENPLKDAWILSLKRQPTLRGLLNNSWPLKSWHARENRTCSRLKETKEAWQHNATRESEGGPFAIITLLAQLK